MAIFEVESFPPVQYLAIFRCVGLSASCLRERRPLLVCIFILSPSWPRLARSSLDEAIKDLVRWQRGGNVNFDKYFAPTCSWSKQHRFIISMVHLRKFASSSGGGGGAIGWGVGWGFRSGGCNVQQGLNLIESNQQGLHMMLFYGQAKSCRGRHLDLSTRPKFYH